jgi:hypothetical protein
MELRSYFRPFVIIAPLSSFFLCACGVIVPLQMARQGRVDFRQLHTAAYPLYWRGVAIIAVVAPGFGIMPFYEFDDFGIFAGLAARRTSRPVRHAYYGSR